MIAFRPPSETPSSSEESAGVPFGVQLLAFLVGVVILMLAGKSGIQDYQVVHKLTNLSTLYDPIPAKWLKVDVRQDATGSSEYYPDVLFEYFVDGKSVWGWRLSLEEMPAERAYWQKRLGKYHVGDTVTAYVNPLDAKDSFVERKSEGIYRVALKALLGLSFCLFGGTLVALSVSGWVRKALVRSAKAKKTGRR